MQYYMEENPASTEPSADGASSAAAATAAEVRDVMNDI